MTGRNGVRAFWGRAGNLRLGASSLVGAVACAGTFSAWNMISRGAVDLAVIAFFCALSYTSVLAGSLVLGVLRRGDCDSDFPTAFLIGFFTISTVVFLLALATPLSIVFDASIVVLAVIGWGLVRRPGAAAETRRASGVAPAMAATLISLVAGTLWSGDSIRAVTESHGMIVFKPWSDCFVHASVVRMFRDAHGLGTLENIMLPGRPAQVYHYATYVIPAAFSAMTDAPCYSALTSFLVPLGSVLTGLAAYALARSWWGPRAGLAATVALVLLPDASAYGVGNRLLGYHWLQQVAPTGMYGVALAAVAWLLLFEGCRERSVRVVVAGLAVAGLVVLYKAHIFVAIAFLTWVAPPLIRPGLRPRWRVAWFVAAVGSFFAATSFARFIPAAPTLRLDGSGMAGYVGKLAVNLNEGWWRERLAVSSSSTSWEVVEKGVVHLFFGTFGAFGLACIVLVPFMVHRRATHVEAVASARAEPRRIQLAIAVIPLVVILNYLVMSLGLALDNNPVTQADELLHRPLVWAYFVVAVWTGGAFYQVVLEPWLARSAVARTILLAGLAGLFAVPFFLGQGVQVGPKWGKDLTNTSMPSGLYQCALFLRGHSRPGDVIQDSAGAPDKALGALSERPEYVIAYADAPKQSLLADRLDAVRRLEQAVDERSLRVRGSQLGVKWYVLRPEGRVLWPRSFLARPAFASGGYHVYALGP